MRKENGILLKHLIIGVIAIIIMSYIFVVVVKNREIEGEKTTQQLEDGGRLNTSEALKTPKTVEGLEIDNMEVMEKEGISTILATITNNTTEEKGEFMIDITFTDNVGNIIATIPGYIKKLKQGETTELNASGTVDFAEAYDVRITKK